MLRCGRRVKHRFRAAPAGPCASRAACASYARAALAPLSSADRRSGRRVRCADNQRSRGPCPPFGGKRRGRKGAERGLAAARRPLPVRVGSRVFVLGRAPGRVGRAPTGTRGRARNATPARGGRGGPHLQPPEIAPRTRGGGRGAQPRAGRPRRVASGGAGRGPRALRRRRRRRASSSRSRPTASRYARTSSRVAPYFRFSFARTSSRSTTCPRNGNGCSATPWRRDSRARSC